MHLYFCVACAFHFVLFQFSYRIDSMRLKPNKTILKKILDCRTISTYFLFVRTTILNSDLTKSFQLRKNEWERMEVPYVYLCAPRTFKFPFIAFESDSQTILLRFDILNYTQYRLYSVHTLKCGEKVVAHFLIMSILKPK